MRSLPAVQTKTEFFAFNGGLDVVTPPLLIPAGFAKEAQNYEQDINGGYRRCKGYERFDGRTAPSSVSYAILTCTLDGSPVVVAGDTVTDNAGTSTAVVLANATTYLVVTRVVGAWPAGNLKVGVDVVGTFTTGPVTDGASSALLAAQYRNLAADEYRDDILPAGHRVVTMTSANPGVVTWTNHGFRKGTPIKFTTTGALPTNITAGTQYYVFGGTDSAIGGANITANTFKVTTDSSGGGTAINTTAGTQSGVHTCVAGDGSVRGVWMYGDAVYAFRNAVDGLSALMWKATSSGWVSVRLFREVSFTAGNGSIAAGQTLTETTGSEASTIMAVVVQTGSLATGTATGRLIVTQPQVAGADNEFEGTAATTSGGGTLTLSGASTAITIAAGGAYEFVNHNFTGAGSQKMYGVNGVSKGFEFDGTTFVPIVTGMTLDTPTHLIAHKQQLFYSFAASVQHSAPGFPYVWSAIVGASEIGMGDTVTGFKIQAGGSGEAALTIATRNSLATLYGSSVLNWQLIPFDSETGAISGTMQRIGTTLMLDDRGIVSLDTSDAYGNFASATLSSRIQTWLRDRRANVVTSCVARDKNQYRIFFSSGEALYVTMEGSKVIGMVPQLFPDPVVCVCSSETSTGAEEIYFGAADGYVYQMERGTSFDGDAIEAFLYLVFNHSQSPRLLKGYRRAALEVSGTGYATFGVSYELGYGSTEYAQPGTVTVEAALSPAYWDSFTWDAFVWDGKSLLPTELDLAGTAENISIRILSSSDYFDSTLLTGVIVHYTPRRQLR